MRTRFILTLLAMLIFNGCSQIASGPSQADIRSALNQVAEETVAVQPGRDAVNPAVTVDSFTTKGTSVEGAKAKVLITATVTYVPAVRNQGYGILRTGRGFPVGYGQDYKLNPLTNTVDVTLYFQKYDTGWRLDRYEQ